MEYVWIEMFVGGLLKFEIFTVLFRFRAEPAERLNPQGGGWVKISYFAVGNGERVTLKIFAIP